MDNVADGVECVTPTQPWLIFTVGPRGAGKKQVIRDLMANGQLHLLTYIDVDSDAMRRRLPEYESYLKYRPDHVDILTKKEAGLICEILTLAGIQAGRNVIVDSCLADAQWRLELINKLKEEYPMLKFGVFRVTAPYKMVVKHAQVRKHKIIICTDVISRTDFSNKFCSAHLEKGCGNRQACFRRFTCSLHGCDS